MQPQYATLWSSIELFELDEPLIKYPFSKKLSAENYWSDAFTQRATKEYKKFIFLSCISPHGASPSAIVDKVWHLHLTYTKSYWEDFCKNTLQKNIHHHPSKGGQDENEKHINWYEETLILYQQTFNEKPPIDIWPLPKLANNNLVNSLHFIPKNNKRTFKICFTIILFFYIISALQFHRINPFLFRGPEFLIFFAYLIYAVITCVFLILSERKKQILLYLNNNFPSDYNVFQAVHFLYGKNRALQTALVHLFVKNIFELNSNNRFRYIAANVPTEGLDNPLYPKILELQDGDSLLYKQINEQFYNADLFTHPAFLAFEKIITLKTKAPKYLFSGVILIGFARILQGFINAKPVGYLMLEIIIFSIIYYVVYLKYNETAIILKESLSRIKADGFKEIETEEGLLQNFAQHGNKALEGFSEYVVLASIFSAYPVSTPYSNYVSTSNADGSSSDGGGSSCGSDGGSSCGSSGCGGCGGSGD